MTVERHYEDEAAGADDGMATVIGVGFMMLFGAIWWLMAAGFAGDAQPVMIVAGAIVVTLLVWRTALLWGAVGGWDARRSPYFEARQRSFTRIGLAEGVAIAAGAIVFGNTGHPQWIPTWCALVVGVHFLPLSRLFAVPAYWMTGLVLIAVAAVTIIVVPLADLAEEAWFVLPGALAAATLWGTAAVLLRTPRLA